MDAVAVATICLAIAGMLLVRRKRWAAFLYRYYNSIPTRSWGPAWFRWQFHPTEQQAKLTVYLYALICLLIAGLALLNG